MNFIIEPVVGWYFENQKLMVVANETEMAVRIISAAEFLASEFDRNCAYYSYSPLGLLLLNYFLPDMDIKMFPKDTKLDGFVMLTYPFSTAQTVNHTIDCTIATLMDMIDPAVDYHTVIPLQEDLFSIELPTKLYQVAKEQLDTYQKKIEICYSNNANQFREFDKYGHILAAG